MLCFQNTNKSDRLQFKYFTFVCIYIYTYLYIIYIYMLEGISFNAILIMDHGVHYGALFNRATVKIRDLINGKLGLCTTSLS